MPDLTTICVHPDTWSAHGIFNPNDWPLRSKAIIRSCGAQLGLLLHMTAEGPQLLDRGRAVCDLRLNDLQKQWKNGRWQLDRSQYLVEVPTVHVVVQAYLASAKTLLDFLAQLAGTEGVVAKVVHGFHKKGDDPGGQLLAFLKNRPLPGRRDQAEALHTFLMSQKQEWIDNLVDARDFLAHPQRGMAQIYWAMELTEAENTLAAVGFLPPRIAALPFHEYMSSTTSMIETFAKEFLHLVRGPEST